MSNNICKHVGLHNAKKILILWNKVPGESHMALVLFADKIPAAYSELVHKTLVSEAGQKAKNFADALNEVKLPDGRNLLNALHTESHIKKVQTNQTFVTPDSINKIKLNELNDMMDKIEEGGDAKKKLEDLDLYKGMNKRKRRNGLSTTPSDLDISDKKMVVALQEQVKQLTGAVEALLVEVRQLKGDRSEPASVAPKTRKII